MEKIKKTKELMVCISCNYSCSYESEFNRHLLTLKHKHRTKLELLEHKNKQKNKEIYNCESCDFKCYHKKNYKSHTLLHTSTNKQENKKFTCLCGKLYKARNSLWYHKKNCLFSKVNNNDNDMLFKKGETSHVSDNELMMMVVKQNNELIQKNSELQTDMLEVLKKGLITNNTINNNHNKTFNVQLFLNETCKDAMNITEFIDSIQVQLSDLDRIGNMGFANGISDIIVKELKLIDITKRPMHCSDLKRETLYIRDEDKWEKEDNEKLKFYKMINSLSAKNLQMLPLWKKANPLFHDSTSITNDTYNRIIIETLESNKENHEKIVKNIAKEVKI